MTKRSSDPQDPFGFLPDEDASELWKAHHVMGVGDEVVYLPTGHKGKITNIKNGIYYVTLPTGHSIGCDRGDLCPADFPPAPERLAPQHKSDVEGLFPVGGSEEAATFDEAAKAELAPFLGNSAGFINAMRAGTVSSGDLTLVKIHLAKVRNHFGVDDVFGERESDSVHLLKLLASKYADTVDGGDTFAKRASFIVGDRVRYKSDRSGRIGKVTAVRSGMIDLRWDDGNEGSSVESVLEAAA